MGTSLTPSTLEQERAEMCGETRMSFDRMAVLEAAARAHDAESEWIRQGLA
jgi:hypothetical protein